MGSTCSVRGFVRLGSSVSVLGNMKTNGDQLYTTAATSIAGIVNFSSIMSVADALNLGSSTSVRCFARFGAGLSAFDCSNLGSTMSLRAVGRAGSSFSILRNARLGGSPTTVKQLKQKIVVVL